MNIVGRTKVELEARMVLAIETLEARIADHQSVNVTKAYREIIIVEIVMSKGGY